MCIAVGRRFVDDAFLPTYIHTIGIDFLEKVVDLERQKVLLQIWDTAGQDRYSDNLSDPLGTWLDVDYSNFKQDEFQLLIFLAKFR